MHGIYFKEDTLPLKHAELLYMLSYMGADGSDHLLSLALPLSYTKADPKQYHSPVKNGSHLEPSTPALLALTCFPRIVLMVREALLLLPRAGRALKFSLSHLH